MSSAGSRTTPGRIDRWRCKPRRPRNVAANGGLPIEGDRGFISACMSTQLAPDPGALLAAAREILPDVVELRRRIHRRPEIGLDLPQTQTVVVRGTRAPGPDAGQGRNLSSVTAVIEGPSPGRTILLRADMDALPLIEATGLDFASEIGGAMHACAHDTHVAMLLGAARILVERRAELHGRVLLMFQPGEEGLGGAKMMLEEGLLDLPTDAEFGPVTGAFAIHTWTATPTERPASRPAPSWRRATCFGSRSAAAAATLRRRTWPSTRSLSPPRS